MNLGNPKMKVVWAGVEWFCLSGFGDRQTDGYLDAQTD